MQILSVLNDVLTGALGPFGPLIAVGGLGVMLILITIPMMLRQKQDPLEKLKQANQRQSAASGGGKTNLRAGKQNKKLDRYASNSARSGSS